MSELVSLSETYQNVRMKGNAYAQVKSIDALRRGLEVLVAIERSAAVSLADLHRQTHIPKATLLRVLRTLQEAGWVERNELEGRYVRASSPGESGQLAEWRARLSSLAAPPREWLQKRVPWPADLAVRDGSAMLVLDAFRPTMGLTVNNRVLGFRPNMIVSAVGRCYLAFCPEQERAQVLRMLVRSASELDMGARKPETIRRLVLHSRQQGYATRDPSQTGSESPERFGALALPIQKEGRVVACLSVAWLPAVVSEKTIVSAHLADLQSAVRSIEERLRTGKFDPIPP